MADKKPEGLTITFQGKPCAPMFEYSNSVGLEPSRGAVYMERVQFQDFVVHEEVPPAPASPTELRTVGRVPPTGTGLQVAGDLVFTEVIDGEEFTVPWKNVILTEKAIEVSLAEDDGANEMCRLEISDPRYGWGTRGLISGWYNVAMPVEATDAAPGTGGPSQDAIDAAAQREKIGSLSRQITTYQGTLDSLERQKVLAEAAKARSQAVGDKASVKAAADELKVIASDLARFKSLSAIAKAQLTALEKGGSVAGVQQANLTPDQQQQVADANRQLIQAQADIDAQLQQQALLQQQISGIKLLKSSGLAGSGGLSLETAFQGSDAKATGQSPDVAIFQAESELQTVRSNLRKARAQLADANMKLDALGAPIAVEGGRSLPGSSSSTVSLGLVSPGGALIPSSTDAGVPWTVKSFLTKEVLPRLWFAPKLKYIADDVGAKQISAKLYDPPELPKKAFHDVLEEFQLLVSWNNDSTVSVWKKNEGELTDSDAKGSAIAFKNDANVDPRVAHAKTLTAFVHVPQVVVVVGAPIIAAARTRLEAVGVRGGRIVPLDEALAGLGLTRSQARSFVLLPTERRGALFGISQEGLREFERWAFKWYGIPGGAAKNSEKLPILDARAALGRAGEFLPLRVFSECHAVISTLEAALASVAAGAAKVSPLAAETFTEQALNQIRAEGDGQLRAVVNIAFSEQASGYRIDKERGLVMFDAPQGNVVRPGRALNEAVLLDRDPTVELEFAFQRRPGIDVPLSLDQRYHSVWVRDKDGKAQPRGAVPAGTAPITIHRPDVQQVDGIDGKSNKALLDVLAQALAQAQFSAPVSNEGAVVEMCRPVAVQLNGSVLSCEWASTIRGWVTTTAHIKAFAPLAPVPKLQTRAFGDFRFDNLVRNSVFVPKGLST